jgi:hypothetical protein
VPVGRRGETIDHLLRPGFHSGTLPKTFARLRRATRKGLAGGSWTAARKCRSQLDRVALDVRRFVERELVALLERSGSWREGELHVGRVHVGVNNIRLELCHDDGNAEPLEVAFEEHGGWLVVESRRPAWIEELAEAQCEALDAALAGLYKVSGVDIVREQVESSLPANTTYALIDDGLVVRWPAGQSGAGATGAVFYDLEQDPRMTPVPMGPHPAGFDAPTLERRRVLFGAVEMPWNAWVRRWTTSDSPAASPQPASS